MVRKQLHRDQPAVPRVDAPRVTSPTTAGTWLSLARVAGYSPTVHLIAPAWSHPKHWDGPCVYAIAFGFTALIAICLPYLGDVDRKLFLGKSALPLRSGHIRDFDVPRSQCVSKMINDLSLLAHC